MTFLKALTRRHGKLAILRGPACFPRNLTREFQVSEKRVRTKPYRWRRSARGWGAVSQHGRGPAPWLPRHPLPHCGPGCPTGAGGSRLQGWRRSGVEGTAQRVGGGGSRGRGASRRQRDAQGAPGREGGGLPSRACRPDALPG